jgi:DNA-binding protein HU-beta
MSIASDVRSYADSALGQAQTRATEVRGDATEFAGRVLSRAAATYTELWTRGDALTKRAGATVEPYIVQLKGYGTAAAERLEQTYVELRKNDQVAKVVTAAETTIGAVQERVTSLLDRQATAPARAGEPTGAPAEAAAKPTAPAKAKPKPTAAAKRTTSATAKPAGNASAANATPARRTTTRRTTKA